MSYIETNLPNGGSIIEWVSAPPIPTHKTSGISREEWALVFTASETFLIDKAKVAFIVEIDPACSFIQPKTPDAPTGFATAALGDTAAALGLSVTYRDIIRSSFERYKETSRINVADPRLILSINAFHMLGWLDDKNRKDQILMGVPYEAIS